MSVIHHKKNLGYGKALQAGFNYACDYEWVCFTDGDDEYDVGELRHMVNRLHRYDLLITFRYSKAYSTWRIFVSWVYNHVLRFLFRSKYHDISSGLKLIKREVLDDIEITSSSPFVGAEIVLKSMLKGYLVGEVGISTYPREFGLSTSTSWKNIFGTIRDMFRVHSEVFSNKPRPESTKDKL